MRYGVEGVEAEGEVAQKFLSILRSRRYVEALYGQAEYTINGMTLRKLVTIADFKSCGEGVVYREKGVTYDRYLFKTADSFYQVFRRALHKLPRQVSRRCGVEGFFAEAYATAMWFLDCGAFESRWWEILRDTEDFTSVVLVPVAYDFAVDLDLKDNPWLAERGGLEKLRLFCDFMAEKLGLEPTVLVSKGVQLRVSPLPLHLLHYEELGDKKWPRIVLERLPEIHKRMALKLAAEFHERHGVRVVVDTQVYEPARILRLDLSVHSGVRAFSIPFKPDMLSGLTWDDVRGRQRSPRYVLAVARRHNGLWGRLVEPEKYLRILGFYLKLGESLRLEVSLPSPRALKTPTLSGWRKVVDPVLGEVEYDARLEGYGWVEVLVKEGIPIPDARLAMAWAVLPVAIMGPKTREGRLPPLVTKEEAVEWLKRCLEEYPDPEKSLEDYIEKLEYNMRYGGKYNIPTWRHLVEEKTEDGKPLAEVFKHLKYPVIYALHQRGYVRLKDKQLHRLIEVLESSGASGVRRGEDGS